MTETKIASHGAKIQNIRIPQFTLKSGEMLCLHWPLPRFSKGEEDFLAVLTGERKQFEFDVYQPLVIANELSVKTYLFGLIYKKVTVFEELKKQRSLSAEDALAILEWLNVSPDTNVSDLSFPHKMRLAIEASALQSRGILFTTAGLDPLGVKEIYSAVAQKLELGFFAIHFSYPTLPSRMCVGIGKCVECRIDDAKELRRSEKNPNPPFQPV